MPTNRVNSFLALAVPDNSQPEAVAYRTELASRTDGSRECRLSVLSGFCLSSFEGFDRALGEIAAARPQQTVINLTEMPNPPAYLVHLLDTFIVALKRNGGKVTMLLPAYGDRVLFTKTGSRPPFDFSAC
ncbi:MAG: hypothetical protein ACFBZ8_05460 [Opitutales bacterium]